MSFLVGIAREELALREKTLWVLNSAKMYLGNTSSNVVSLIPFSEMLSVTTFAEIGYPRGKSGKVAFNGNFLTLALKSCKLINYVLL